MLKALKNIFKKDTPATSAPTETVNTPPSVTATPEKVAPAAQQPKSKESKESKASTKKPRSRPAKPIEPQTPWSLSDFVVEPAEGKTRFHDFVLTPELMHAIQDLG
ncbi:MAG: hypothetical protein J6N68_14745, partial [Shewanella sp.]|nr:hypothetical protein [Shewanella sp.]